MANITEIANKVAEQRKDKIAVFVRKHIAKESKELLGAFLTDLDHLQRSISEDDDQAPDSLLKVTVNEIEKIAGADLTPDEIEDAVNSSVDAISSVIVELLEEESRAFVNIIKKAVTQIPLNEEQIFRPNGNGDELSADDPLQKSSYVNTKPVAFRVVLETPRDIDDEEMTAQVMLFSERHPDAELSDFGPTTSGKFYIDVIFYTEQASRKAELENDPEMDVIAVEQYPDSVFSGEVDPNDVGL